MLVRLGVASADLVRVVRPQRAVRALPGSSTKPGYEPPPTAQTAYAACEEPVTRFDRQRAEQAYRAADLVQPRPGLFLHVQA